jgi:tRNA modification GTPase
MTSGIELGQDTIAAIATSRGRAAIGVMRVTGPATRHIAEQLLGALPLPRLASLRHFHASDGSLIDTGLVLFFPGPGSYTGEDAMELHGHGSSLALDALLARVLELGARLARPGEFTERAFLNGKIDLLQAEAVADLIDSASATAARAAAATLDGEFSRLLSDLSEQLVQLRVRLEASFDFSDEPVDEFIERDVMAGLRELGDRLDSVRKAARQGVLLRDGFKIVICGRPNVGKSSLLNALVRHERAIVTHIPGTTRDTVDVSVEIHGVPVHLTDTAGLRVNADIAEQEGIRRARLAAQHADHRLLVLECGQTLGIEETELATARGPVTLVYNKIDLHGEIPKRDCAGGTATIWLSAKTGAGIDLLEQHLLESAGFQQGEEGSFSPAGN